MKDADFYVPKYLDAPERYLFWTVDEAIILLAPVVVGLMAGQMLVGLLLGPLFLMGLKKLKGSQGEKALQHAFYWYFQPLWGHGLRVTPPSYIREYIG